MRDQKGWTEHAEFMDALEAEHFFVLGGPLRNYSKHRAMLIVNAPNEQELRRRLEAGPGCARVCYELSTSILGDSPRKTTVTRPGSQPRNRFTRFGAIRDAQRAEALLTS